MSLALLYPPGKNKTNQQQQQTPKHLKPVSFEKRGERKKGKEESKKKSLKYFSNPSSDVSPNFCTLEPWLTSLPNTWKYKLLIGWTDFHTRFPCPQPEWTCKCSNYLPEDQAKEQTKMPSSRWSHWTQWPFWNKTPRSLSETLVAGIKPATIGKKKKPVAKLAQKWTGQESRYSKVPGMMQQEGRWWAVLWIDLCFLGLLQHGLDRPYGLALTLPSLHALRAAALAMAGFHFLLFLALGILNTGWFNIIIQRIRWEPSGRSTNVNLEGYFRITFTHRALRSHGRTGY